MRNLERDEEDSQEEFYSDDTIVVNSVRVPRIDEVDTYKVQTFNEAYKARVKRDIPHRYALIIGVFALVAFFIAAGVFCALAMR